MVWTGLIWTRMGPNVAERLTASEGLRSMESIIHIINNISKASFSISVRIMLYLT
jgi:hypothetical protein